MRNRKSALGWRARLFISAGLANLPAQTSAQTETSSGASAPAQASPNASEQGNQNPEMVRMSSFEVTTTQGHGYTASTAATAAL